MASRMIQAQTEGGQLPLACGFLVCSTADIIYAAGWQRTSLVGIRVKELQLISCPIQRHTEMLYTD